MTSHFRTLFQLKYECLWWWGGGGKGAGSHHPKNDEWLPKNMLIDCQQIVRQETTGSLQIRESWLK